MNRFFIAVCSALLSLATACTDGGLSADSQTGTDGPTILDGGTADGHPVGFDPPLEIEDGSQPYYDAGGACAYMIVDGTCTITQLGHDVSGVPTQTTFDFTATGATAVSEHGRLLIDESADPSSSCLMANGITLGEHLACSEWVETKGSCIPHRFVVPSFQGHMQGCPPAPL